MIKDESRVMGVHAPPPRLTTSGAALVAAGVAGACAPALLLLTWLW